MQADHDISKGGNPCCAGYARVDCSYVERGSVRGRKGVQTHIVAELASWSRGGIDGKGH